MVVFACILVSDMDLQRLVISSTVWFDVEEHPLLSWWWSSPRLSQLSPVIDALCTSHHHLPAFTAVYGSYLISHPEMSRPPPISRHINHPSCHMIGLKSQFTMAPHFAKRKSKTRDFIPPLELLHVQKPLIIPIDNCLLLHHKRPERLWPNYLCEKRQGLSTSSRAI